MLRGFSCESADCPVQKLGVPDVGLLNVQCEKCGLSGEVGEVGERANAYKPFDIWDFLVIVERIGVMKAKLE